MKFTTYQLLADIFHNSQFKGREEIVITLPDNSTMTEHRATMVFQATLLDGAPRNVCFSVLSSTGDVEPAVEFRPTGDMKLAGKRDWLDHSTTLPIGQGPIDPAKHW